MGNNVSIQEIVDAAPSATYNKLSSYPPAQLCLIRAKCGAEYDGKGGCYSTLFQEIQEAMRVRYNRRERGYFTRQLPEDATSLVENWTSEDFYNFLMKEACNPAAVSDETKAAASQAVQEAADANVKAETTDEPAVAKEAKARGQAAWKTVIVAGKQMVWECSASGCTATARKVAAKNCKTTVCKTKTGRRTSCSRKSVATKTVVDRACKGVASAVRKASFPYKDAKTGRAFRRVMRKDGTYRRVYQK